MKSVYISASDAGYDNTVANVFYNGFKHVGVPVFYLPNDVNPGQNRRDVAKHTLRKYDYFLSIFSEQSVRAGLHLVEVRKALEYMDELPEGDVFILPLWTGNPENWEDSKKHYPAEHLKPYILFPDWQKTVEKILRRVGVSDFGNFELKQLER